MSIVNTPSGYDSSFYYGSYGSSQTLTNLDDTLWEKFIDSYFPSGGTGPFNEALNSAGSWPPTDLETYNASLIVEGIFGAALKDFFYVYAPEQGISTTSSEAEIAAAFETFLGSPVLASSAKRQSTIMHWVFEVLVEMLERFHEAAPTKGGYALAMADAEADSVDNLVAISFGTQSSSSDYGTQRDNMEAQQDAEEQRSYRAIAGKRGQDAQASMTSMRDNASSHSQMMSTLLQSMESMIQAIIKR